MAKIKAGIIGATGYAGLEIVRLLLNHPEVSVAAVSSVSYEGQTLSHIYPALRGHCDLTLVKDTDVVTACDVIFGSMPTGVSEPIARQCFNAGKLYIDMGADFRLTDEADYIQWYGKKYEDPELHQQAVYCIPEIHRERLLGKNKKLIGNPGCYPTSIALGLYPAVKGNAVDLSTLVIDSKSGVTGAGRGLTQNTHYPDCNEAFAPYKIACHRHTPEIEQTLGELSGERPIITFVPHLLPVNRGIVSTMYVSLQNGVGKEAVRELYTAAYEKEPFVRVLPEGEIANLKNVRYSNHCDISLHFDNRTNRIIIVSAIDNMGKGAAGQAIQNMNLALGLPETAGLQAVPPAF